MFSAPPDTRAIDDARAAGGQEARRGRATRRDAQDETVGAAVPARGARRTCRATWTRSWQSSAEGARILKDYTPTFSGLSGQAQASSYNMLGAFAYLIELWGRPGDADINGDGAVDEDE